jgi:hypothetical protein
MNEPDQPIDPLTLASLANPDVSNPPADSRAQAKSEVRSDLRSMLLPWEGVEALRTVLGILDDHEVRVDAVAYESISVKLLEAVMMGPQDGDIPIEVSLPEANLLLEGLRFTDVMSMDLPFYDMVVDTINFVGDQLLAMWSTNEWLEFHDTKRA